MKKIATFQMDGGERSAVYQDNKSFLVRFWNKDGVHMDASDYHTKNLADAMNEAGEEHPECVRID